MAEAEDRDRVGDLGELPPLNFTPKRRTSVLTHRGREPGRVDTWSLPVIVWGAVLMTSALRHGPLGRACASIVGITLLAAGFFCDALSWRVQAARGWFADSWPGR
jgi:hypothetical protein